MTDYNDDFYRRFVKQHSFLTESLEYVPSLLEMIKDERFSMREARGFFLCMYQIISWAESTVDDRLLLEALEDMANKIIALPCIDLTFMSPGGTSIIGQIVCKKDHTSRRMVNLCELFENHPSIARVDFKHLMKSYVVHQKTLSDRDNYLRLPTSCPFVAKPVSLMEVIFENYDDSDEAVNYNHLMVAYNRFLVKIAKLSFEAGSNVIPKSKKQLLHDLNRCKISNDLQDELIAHYCDNFPSLLLALEITVSDEFFKVIETEKKSDAGRFFGICKALPYELQCKIAHNSVMVDRNHISGERLTKAAISVLSS